MDKLHFNRSMIVAVDFDGTVVMHEWPKIGAPVPGAVGWLHRFSEAGARLILWTNRSGETLKEAVAYMAEHNVPLWAINENPEQHNWTDSPKIYCHTLIDDVCHGVPLLPLKGGRPYVDWRMVGPVVFKRVVLWNPEEVH